MKKIIFATISILASVFAYSAEKTIDASSNQMLQDSFFEVFSSLNEAQQQEFTSAMATIGIVLSQKYGSEVAHKKYVELVHGKTAEQIINTSKSLAPNIKSSAKRKINGNSMLTFNESVGQMLITLPLDKQRIFSAAIAKIMYDAEKKNQKKEDMAKSLDGFDADAIIEKARKINAPFLDADESEIKLSPLTEAEKKQYNIKEEKKEEKLPFSQSLVPRE